MSSPLLKSSLDRLAAFYDESYRETDPVAVVHRFSDPFDCEVAGLAVSVLSYGAAAQIRRSAENMLARIDQPPSAFARNLSEHHAEAVFKGFKHRWTDGHTLARLWCAIGDITERHGSLGAFVRSIDNPGDDTIEATMVRFADRINHASAPSLPGTERIPPLIPSPAAGSACKRLAMYFRWMVRGPDGVDLGLWDFISPARLVIPLDRHIARMGRRLGLTNRLSDNWKTALDITHTLRRLNPCDPLKYDFALVRPGILGACPPRGNNRCGNCPLVEVCRRTV